MRSGAIMVLAGIIILVAATGILWLWGSTTAEEYNVYSQLGFNSATAIRVAVPQGASDPAIEIMVAVDESSGSGVQVAVSSGQEIVASFKVEKGGTESRVVNLPGPGSYNIVLVPETLGSKAAVRAVLTYKVPAITTERSSLLAPLGVISDFLAGLGVAASRASTGQEKHVNTSSIQQGEK